MNVYQEWKRKRKMKSSCKESDPSPDITDGFQFPQFTMLNDDIVVHIFSYLVEAPFRSGTKDGHSTLTKVLPYVKREAFLLGRDGFWKQALTQNVKEEPFLWKQALERIVHDHGHRDSNTNGCISDAMQDDEAIIHKALQVFPRAQDELSHNNNRISNHISSSLSYEKLFQYIVKEHIQYRSPVFYMPGDVQIGKEFGLHFFEPRYRILIAEVMATYPPNFSRGEPITITATSGNTLKQFPSFLYAHQAPLGVGTPASIVQVKQCIIFPDGTSDVFLVPIAHVWLTQLRRRPGSGGLYDACSIRMGESQTRQLEHQSIHSRFLESLPPNLANIVHIYENRPGNNTRDNGSYNNLQNHDDIMEFLAAAIQYAEQNQPDTYRPET